MKDEYFYVDDVEVLRGKLRRASAAGTLQGRVWDSVVRRARNAPLDFPWFTPIVALVEGEAQDVENAKGAIRRYLGSLDVQSFGMGLHFHFWCFAFPHARWALYFQWLRAMGAWDEEEAVRLRDEFLSFQYVHFFSGMRTKPEPECVDNQSLSLCFSNALVGHLFAKESAVARRMAEDGFRRLPDMLGGFPASGYSGEGSTYMDNVVGPAIPFVVELLERVKGGNWFDRTLPPNGGSAAAVCRMIGREWMPGGLTLPWDHYGYGTPTRSCVAYTAQRTGDPFYLGLLEQHADWSYEIQVGWGYDDLVWALIRWPERTSLEPIPLTSWCEPEVGAALVSEDNAYYLMQMWDRSEPVSPSRSHVNPNAVVLSVGGKPLTVDGVEDKDCLAFAFPDTAKEVGYMDIGHKRKTNFGGGCGGAHSVILVDGWEGMRAFGDYPQTQLLSFSAEGKEVATDVSPMYRERWPDAVAVRRKSRLCAERFWVIEDLAVFGEEHDVTARFYLRPDRVAECGRGVTIETAEGMRLTLLPLVGADGAEVDVVEGYPASLDGRSVRANFRQRGRVCRWLWLAWAEATREVYSDEAEGWLAKPEMEGAGAECVVSLTVPPFLQGNHPFCRGWWFRKEMEVPAGGAWLRLPRRMQVPRLWVEGEEVDLTKGVLCMKLLEPEVRLPEWAAGKRVEVKLYCETGHSQYAPGGNGGSGYNGHPVLLVSKAVPGVERAEYRDGVVTVVSGGREWSVKHELMEL